MTAAAVRTPPPRPASRECIVCGKDRKPERSRAYGKQMAEVDPFCSRKCCEDWYGIEGRGATNEEET